MSHPGLRLPLLPWLTIWIDSDGFAATGSVDRLGNGIQTGFTDIDHTYHDIARQVGQKTLVVGYAGIDYEQGNGGDRSVGRTCGIRGARCRINCRGRGFSHRVSRFGRGLFVRQMLVGGDGGGGVEHDPGFKCEGAAARPKNGTKRRVDG
ncbi:MAG: hypothetical protein IPJ48_11605 [Propionivibrio sp.]|uniref:Uncharacterized protein n=1 Tax=Candidatus Propionivibrio dominans TaxID=2954373 RepID=A0A9D7F7R8_9RHOO|nr:hypothetical protein [Candidatus Propionivibrio dominans]